MAINRREKSIQSVGLSKRLECIVELAGRGDTLCDVGCDHAHVPIRLLQEGRFCRAIGMDVIDGPLGKAKGNLELYGLDDKVELRLSDGLDAFQKGEADTLVITGMGGTLMRDILMREPEKTRSLPALVLGPQSDPDMVRAAVRELGFSLEDERLVYEDGKYYPVLRAVRTMESPEDIRSISEKSLFPAGTSPQLCREAEDLFGPLLLRRKDPVLREFLVRRIAVLKKIRDSVSRAAGETPVQQAGKNPAGQAVPAETGGSADNPDPARAVTPEAGESADKPACAVTPEAGGSADDPDPACVRIPNQDGEEGHKNISSERTKKLKKKHLDKKREIEHSLEVYQAALTVFS